ncbi:hypothetical protein [Photobacterium ganghwense]|uniref:hypothetical protein n=1 Tax=Photobacterium ganghwense TaxID=320778 RepID=UPI0039F130DC
MMKNPDKTQQKQQSVFCNDARTMTVYFRQQLMRSNSRLEKIALSAMLDLLNG